MIIIFMHTCFFIVSWKRIVVFVFRFRKLMSQFILSLSKQ